MLRTEKRNRSISFTGDRGQCNSPRLRPLGPAEAENLLKNIPMQLNEVDEEEMEYIHPKLPTPHGPEEEEKIDELSTMTSKFHLTDAHLLHIEKRMLDEVMS